MLGRTRHQVELDVAAGKFNIVQIPVLLRLDVPRDNRWVAIARLHACESIRIAQLGHCCRQGAQATPRRSTETGITPTRD